ncbi:hypothetical protein LCGC14_2899490, partial [marine sediment metagenome]
HAKVAVVLRACKHAPYRSSGNRWVIDAKGDLMQTWSIDMPTHILQTPQRLWALTVGLAILLGPAAVLAAVLAEDAAAVGKPKISRKEVFSCEFKTELSKQWTTVGGKWERQDGYLKQLDPRPADPTKAILVLGDNSDDVSHDVSVVAKLRLDAWKDGEWARAGISVCSDPTNGHGLNLVFHRGKLNFMHDFVIWGSSVEFPYQPGTWYWMKLSKKGGEVKGKAWRDEDPEPADWMITWKIPVAEVSGYPALVGGSGGPGDDICTVSFAQCEVLLGEAPFGYYTKKPRWHETMAASRAALASQEAALSAKLPDQTGTLLRTGLWKSLRRDFSDRASLGQMAAEQQDKIWTEDWPFDQVEVLAQRYAHATGAGLTEQARELAANARTDT